MDRFFKLKQNGTDVRTEIMAGLTTFMTMAYILVVNPLILTGGTGMQWESVFLATAIGAGVMTIVMGLFVNFPVALAPGMGLNAYFATVVATSNGHFTYQAALAAVFMSGIIFIILTVTKVRQLMLVAVPDNLKHAITVGIGLFITIIGMKNSGLLAVAVTSFKDIKAGGFNDVSGAETVFHMGSLHDPNVIIVMVGLLIISALMVLRVRGAILFGMLGTTVVAALMGQVKMSKDVKWMPDFSQLNLFQFDFGSLLMTGIVTAIATFTFVELFDTFGTMVGTATRAGIMKNKEEGNRRVGKAMLYDAIGVSFGAAVGTSTVTAFVESSAGVAEGGRTGLTAITTGVCFLLALFLAPIAMLIPASATAAALIVVGVLMVFSIREIDFSDYVVGIPAFLTIVMMPFTYNIANGISFGIFTYVILATIARIGGKTEHKVHWLMWVLAVLILARYVFLGSEG